MSSIYIIFNENIEFFWSRTRIPLKGWDPHELSMQDFQVRYDITATKGVQTAEWNAVTQTIRLKYEISNTLFDAFQKVIAKVGHYTENFKANDFVYNKLPEYWQYKR